MEYGRKVIEVFDRNSGVFFKKAILDRMDAFLQLFESQMSEIYVLHYLWEFSIFSKLVFSVILKEFN